MKSLIILITVISFSAKADVDSFLRCHREKDGGTTTYAVGLKRFSTEIGARFDDKLKGPGGSFQLELNGAPEYRLNTATCTLEVSSNFRHNGIFLLHIPLKDEQELLGSIQETPYYAMVDSGSQMICEFRDPNEIAKLLETCDKSERIEGFQKLDSQLKLISDSINQNSRIKEINSAPMSQSAPTSRVSQQ